MTSDPSPLAIAVDVDETLVSTGGAATHVKLARAGLNQFPFLVWMPSDAAPK